MGWICFCVFFCRSYFQGCISWGWVLILIVVMILWYVNDAVNLSGLKSACACLKRLFKFLDYQHGEIKIYSWFFGECCRGRYDAADDSKILGIVGKVCVPRSHFLFKDFSVIMLSLVFSFLFSFLVVFDGLIELRVIGGNIADFAII